MRLELLGKTLPVPSFFEICWSVPDNTLTFCSLSDKVVEELQELFRESFQLDLCPFVPWDAQAPDASRVPRGSAKAPLRPSLPPGVDPLTSAGNSSPGSGSRARRETGRS